jgi:nucleotide-binding universal stress UspA family protein
VALLKFRGREREPPDPNTLAIKALLLASEGRPIGTRAIDLAATIARRSGAEVRVLSIARVWGAAFGLPNPGLLPNKREWEQQRSLVADAVQALQRRGLKAAGTVAGTRNAARKIVAEAKAHGCGAIVMTADEPRHWLVANLLWSNEPYRVRRLARVPVYLVIDGKT